MRESRRQGGACLSVQLNCCIMIHGHSSSAGDGKDQVVFISEEEEAQIAQESESDMDEAVRQAVKEDGEIDWDCPCLQGMASGPCGEAFKVIICTTSFCSNEALFQFK